MAPRLATWLTPPISRSTEKGSARCSRSWSQSRRVAMTCAGDTSPHPDGRRNRAGPLTLASGCVREARAPAGTRDGCGISRVDALRARRSRRRGDRPLPRRRAGRVRGGPCPVSVLTCCQRALEVLQYGQRRDHGTSSARRIVTVDRLVGTRRTQAALSANRTDSEQVRPRQHREGRVHLAGPRCPPGVPAGLRT